MPPSGKKSVDRAGVLGVLCHGDKGTRRFGFDAPGRVRPACSRCSVPVSKKIGVLECKIQSYHLSRQGGLQLFAELGISWDQLFPEPRSEGSGW